MDLKIEQKGDIREHIYSLPDTYIGSVKPKITQEWVIENLESPHTSKFVQKEISIIDGIIQLFNEIRANAIDNVWQSRDKNIPVKEIKFYISKKEISVYNDGLTIPIEKQINKRTNEEIYKPQLVFGEFWTSTNYGTEKRKTAGKNGYGAKLVNVFSKKFFIETYDIQNKILYPQKWKKNLLKKYEPKLENVTLKKGYTKITYKLDFKRFELKEYTDDILSYFYRLCYDTAMTTQLKVYLNDELLSISSLEEYTKLFRKNDEYIKEILSFSTVDSKVILTSKDVDEKSNLMGFTNGMWNKKGGVHVDAWSKEIYKHLLDIFNKKRKTKSTEKKNDRKGAKKDEVKLTPGDIKNLFSIYILCELDNAVYDSQSKNTLESPKPIVHLDENDIKKLKKTKKWSIAKEIELTLKAKKHKQLKSILDSKKVYKNIPSLKDANFAGTKKGRNCCLIVCEGKSASTYATIGIEKGIFDKVGTDWFGILPLKGKILNVRKANQKQILNNKEIQNVIYALGLKIDVDYTQEENYNTLKYGKLIILADADTDGTHIRGLIINFFEEMFPTLCQRNDFVIDMKTPLYRVNYKNKRKSFYTTKAFNKFLFNHSDIKKDDIEYFKGLGATNKDDVLDSYGEVYTIFDYDDNAHDNIELAFGKAKEKNRKLWLGDYDPNNTVELISEKKKENITTYSDFINYELIQFSMADNIRSIPSIMDGYKPSQRKLIYTGIKKKIYKLKKFDSYISVASDLTCYHHGAVSLVETMFGLAQVFPGSNNVTFTQVKGQMGTRLEGGDDHTASRYASICLDKNLVTSIFRKEDYLTYLEDDGSIIEPKYFLPIVPIVLFNTIRGIGTGYSTFIPCYNPREVINATKYWIACKQENLEWKMEDLTPWYRDFNGKISKNVNKYITKGIFTNEDYKNDIKINITELPIGIWTEDYYEFLKQLREDKKIKSLKRRGKGIDIINFEIVVEKDFDTKLLNLSSSLSVNNFVLFDANCKIKKYENTVEIIDDFCRNRYQAYVIRKLKQLEDLKLELQELGEKLRFIKQVVNEEIIVFENKIARDKENIVKQIEENKYLKFNDDYKYLVKIPLYKLTEEEQKKIENDLVKMKEKITILENTTEESIWMKEIEEIDKYIV